MANLARSNIFHRKARSAISILAVGVGVMLFLVLVGMSEGSLREVAERMMNVDADLMVHSAGWSPGTCVTATFSNSLATVISART